MTLPDGPAPGEPPEGADWFEELGELVSEDALAFLTEPGDPPAAEGFLRVDPGTFLCAWPDLEDPNFRHRVVLLAHHDERGAYGLVVNDPLPLTSAAFAEEQPELGALAVPIFRGGPVGQDTLQFLHRVPDAIPGGLQLAEDLWIGGEFAALVAHLAREPERAVGEVRLFLGCAGWSASQLESELVGGSWVPAAVSTDVTFSPEPGRVWRRVLESLGSIGKALADLPPDVRWN